ncbi:MAG: rRNA maturation RNase YbeY [bacterium]|nr:rRNA maturation RNase YbeY [bacterium]MCP4967561.1 rRNA maturation RNase YbeY [bacterium]
MDITFKDEQDDPLPTEKLVELAELAMAAESLPATTQLAISLIDNAAMAELNSVHMGKTGPTDVLSFPIEDFSGGVEVGDIDGPPLLLGDIFICPAVVRANATATGVAFEDEMALMVVHGVLHLLGRDHMIEAEAEAMEQREREILALVGRERP